MRRGTLFEKGSPPLHPSCQNFYRRNNGFSPLSGKKISFRSDNFGDSFSKIVCRMTTVFSPSHPLESPPVYFSTDIGGRSQDFSPFI